MSSDLHRESVVDERKVTLMRGMRSKNGRAVLTSERILFFDQKYDGTMGFAVGGILAGKVAERLQERHEEGGPLLDVPLADVAGIERAKKGLSKDVLVLKLRDGGEHRFLGLYEAWEEPLGRLLRR